MRPQLQTHSPVGGLCGQRLRLHGHQPDGGRPAPALQQRFRRRAAQDRRHRAPGQGQRDRQHLRLHRLYLRPDGLRHRAGRQYGGHPEAACESGRGRIHRLRVPERRDRHDRPEGRRRAGLSESAERGRPRDRLPQVHDHAGRRHTRRRAHAGHGHLHPRRRQRDGRQRHLRGQRQDRAADEGNDRRHG